MSMSMGEKVTYICDFCRKEAAELKSSGFIFLGGEVTIYAAGTSGPVHFDPRKYEFRDGKAAVCSWSCLEKLVKRGGLGHKAHPQGEAWPAGSPSDHIDPAHRG